MSHSYKIIFRRMVLSRSVWLFKYLCDVHLSKRNLMRLVFSSFSSFGRSRIKSTPSNIVITSSSRKVFKVSMALCCTHFLKMSNNSSWSELFRDTDGQFLITDCNSEYHFVSSSQPALTIAISMKAKTW